MRADPTTHKQCAHCRRVLAMAAFHNYIRNADGKQNMCRACHKRIQPPKPQGYVPPMHRKTTRHAS